MNSQMTALALAGKCAGRGASGFSAGRPRGLGSARAGLPLEQAGQREQPEARAGALQELRGGEGRMRRGEEWARCHGERQSRVESRSAIRALGAEFTRCR